MHLNLVCFLLQKRHIRGFIVGLFKYEIVYLFGFLLPLHELVEHAVGQKERVKLLDKNESYIQIRGMAGTLGEQASAAIWLRANIWLLWQPVKSHYL